MVGWVFVNLLIIGVLKYVNSSQSLYDEKLYASVLDNMTCQRHLEEMEFFEFFDAGGRIPQSIKQGGQLSLGNYRQCLSITQQVHRTTHVTIIGKYCMIGIPLRQMNRSAFDPGANLELRGTLFELFNNMKDNATEIKRGFQFKRTAGIIMRHSNFRGMLQHHCCSELELKVAVCIPRSCTTYQAFGQYVEMLNVSYKDLYCRLPGDKIFSTPEYVAVITMAILGTLTLLSTSYDLYNAFGLQKVPAETSKLLTSFSVFTNTRRLLTFSKTPESIDCLDGLRSLSILWVVIGHAFSNQIFLGMSINLFESDKWAVTSEATWVQSAVISVDTFFMISGLLVVHTTVNKMTPMSLVRNIHLFYLRRMLRMSPLLAAVVLFQASLLQHSADGPAWPVLANSIRDCRKWWWSTLLHVQNYVSYNEMCLAHSWYLCSDTLLHILSPLVLFWVLRGGRFAWIGLTAGIMTSIIYTTIYCYHVNNPEVSLLRNGPDIASEHDYFEGTFNTFKRSRPFIIGMTFGYLLHVWREGPRRIPKCLITIGWLAALALGSGIVYSHNKEAKSNKFWNSLVSSCTGDVWALVVGWVVFACDAGYGGPINWFLSLTIWKFLARISYSLYLIHYPLQGIIRAQSEVPFSFSPRTVLFLLCTDISLSLIVAIALCVLVDAPFSTLQKILLQGKSKLAEKKEEASKLEVPMDNDHRPKY